MIAYVRELNEIPRKLGMTAVVNVAGANSVA